MSFHRNKKKAARNPPKGVTVAKIYSCATQAQLDKLLGQKKLNEDPAQDPEEDGISK